jgi:hypothetical protein
MPKANLYTSIDYISSWRKCHLMCYDTPQHADSCQIHLIAFSDVHLHSATFMKMASKYSTHCMQIGVHKGMHEERN